jgi:glycosyltransferase involved in cell wall biosynthesis
VAAEAHTSLAAVRGKVEAAFGRFSLSDTPPPQAAGAEEETVTILNEGVRGRRLVRMTYLSRSSDEVSTRIVEPYLLRREERGWYVEAFDRTRAGRRTFKVSYVKEAALTDERYEPRAEMRDLAPSLGGQVGTALVRFSAARARYELEGRERVRLLGAVSADEVPALVARSHVICQPSLVEPFGLATLEAMAGGRSVVATAVGGPAEFVPPEAGILVDPFDVSAIADALTAAVALPSPNPAARAAAERHDVNEQARRVEKILAAARDRRASPPRAA